MLDILQRISLAVHSRIAFVVGFGLFLVMFYIVGDVSMRYLFSKPFPASVDLSEIVLVFVICLGATYTQVSGGHIRLGILTDRFGHRLQGLLNIVFLLCGLVILSLLIWQTFDYAVRSWNIKEASMDYSVPIYPAKFAVTLGFFLLFLQFLLDLVINIIELAKGWKRKP